MSSRIDIPYGATRIITRLQQYGYEAYVVGGCVRDSLLGKKPKDWDICTSATPKVVKKILSEFKIFDTGIKHGTVTVVVDGAYEVTTFRKDGKYTDHRRPDEVSFDATLEDDLARRDFTINAMACNYERFIDLAGGEKDLKAGTLCCVGDPDARFQEDALRILRALRFASTYCLTIEEKTEEALRRNAGLLRHIARERIRDELCKLLMGEDVLRVLEGYKDIITQIIPDLKPCVGFSQNNPYHCYDVYDHIVHTVAAYKGEDLTIKVALLLHDIGKPECYSEDERGGHFYSHGEASARLAQPILKRLRFDNEMLKNVTELIFYHNNEIKPTPRVVRRWLNLIGEEQFRRLLDLREADIAGHAPQAQGHNLEELNEVRTVLDKVIADRDCFTLKDLHINGREIMDLGLTEGKEVGEVLRCLLEEVMEGNIRNTYHDLKCAAESIIYGIE